MTNGKAIDGCYPYSFLIFIALLFSYISLLRCIWWEAFQDITALVITLGSATEILSDISTIPHQAKHTCCFFVSLWDIHCSFQLICNKYFKAPAYMCMILMA